MTKAAELDDQTIARIVRRAIAAKLRDEVPSMADHPIPEARETARDWEVEPLYDSSRSYTEQLASYKQFQGKESIEI